VFVSIATLGQLTMHISTPIIHEVETRSPRTNTEGWPFGFVLNASTSVQLRYN